MKGFIEVTNKTDGLRALISVKEIKRIEECGNFSAIICDFTTTKKSNLNGWFFIKETYEEVIEKIKAAE